MSSPPHITDKRQQIRGSRKQEWLGALAGHAMRLWARSLWVEIDDRVGALGPATPPHPVIFLLWHNRVLTLPALWSLLSKRERPAVVLTSASKDGAVVAAAMKVFRMDSVRGSSSRRGAAALVALRRALGDGMDVCITPDGPKGPRYEMQPGVIKLAQSTGAPIVFVHLDCPSAWRLKTWDKLVIPKPFSHVRVIVDGALVVPRDLDEAGFETERARIEAAMLALTEDI